MERDAEKSYLTGDTLEAGPMAQLPGSSIIYRLAIGPQQGRRAGLVRAEEPTPIN